MQLTLDNLLTYKNERIIQRYTQDYPNAALSAQEALAEFLKFVWLCHQHRYDKISKPHETSLNFVCTIHVEMTEIDNMWHTFLLFTHDYQEFCRDYLNNDFFHHEPLAHIGEIDKDKYAVELENYLSYIYEKLGEATVLKWFASPE